MARDVFIANVGETILAFRSRQELLARRLFIVLFALTTIF